MNVPILRYLIIAIFIAIVIILPVKLIKGISKKAKKTAGFMTVAPSDSPYISVRYEADGGLLDDGKCGWLDIECENGSEETIALNFDKKHSTTVFVPLTVAKYRISYRAKSKAALVAEGVLTSINESNGTMGSFANAVYSAGVGRGQFSSVVVDVDEKFVLKLQCSTNGLEKNCEVIG